MENRKKRTLFFVRHGERLDCVDPNWEQTATRPYDSPLTKEGKRQAILSGRRIADLLGNEITCEDTALFSSPFLRTLETAEGISRGISEKNQRLSLEIKIESPFFPSLLVFSSERPIFFFFVDGIGEWLKQSWFQEQPQVPESMTVIPGIDQNHQSVTPTPQFPETVDDLRRYPEAVFQLLSHFSQFRNFIFVCHGMGVQFIANEIGKKEGLDVLVVDYAAITYFTENEDHTWHNELFCDSSHWMETN